MGLRLPLAPGRPRSAVASRPAGARAKPAKPGRRAIARRTLAAAAGDAAPLSRLRCRTGMSGFHWFRFAHSDAGPVMVRGVFGAGERGAPVLRSKPAVGHISYAGPPLTVPMRAERR